MSTEALPGKSPFKTWAQEIARDPTQVRALRFAAGVTLSVALAYGINWPLSFLFPVLTSVFLSMPLPMPSLRAGLRNMLHTLLAFGLGLVFSLFFLKYPAVYILMLGLVLFHLYYYLNRGGSFWLTLMSIIAILMLPMLANTHDGLAVGLSTGFVFSSWLTVLMVWFSHLLIPDPGYTGNQKKSPPGPPGFQSVYSPQAAQKALKSTLVVFPIATLFIIFDLSGYLLVMIFSAIFILKPELSAGKEAGKNSLISTILGGACAWLFYWLIVAMPEYHFFLALMLFTTLIFGLNIFAGKPTSKYYGSAFIALLILVNGGMAEGAEFLALFATRIALIVLAVMYVVFALKLLDSYWPAEQRFK